VGEITQVGENTQSHEQAPHDFGNADVSDCIAVARFWPVHRIWARALHKRGRRRVSLRSGWVGTPRVISGQAAQFITPVEEQVMKWTKPEAEVVAVTMEVTAYVATL